MIRIAALVITLMFAGSALAADLEKIKSNYFSDNGPDEFSDNGPEERSSNPYDSSQRSNSGLLEEIVNEHAPK